MKILKHELDEKNHAYKFIATPDDGVWTSEVNKVVKQLAKQVRLKGYRPGKVPPNVALRYLNMNLVFQQALSKITGPLYKQLIEDKELQSQNIIEDSYRISVDKISMNDVEITYAFDLIPTVKVKNYDKIKGVKPEKITVTDKEVEESLQKQAGENKLDDKFVKSLKLKNINTLDELKKYQRQIILWSKEEKDFIRLRTIIGDDLVKNATIDYIPEKILREQESSLMKQYSTNRNGVEQVLEAWFGKDNEEMKKMTFFDKIKKLAKHSVILSLALEQIMDEKKLQLTEQDKEAFYKKLSFTNNISMEDAKAKLSGEENESLMLHEKIFKALIEMNKNND